MDFNDLDIYEIRNSFTSAKKLEYETFNFPGGEVHIKIKEEINSDRVRINCRVSNSDQLMRLVFSVDALRRMGTKYIEAFIPYIPYARQDRVMVLGEPLSVKVFADIINSLKLDRLICYDIHNDSSLALFDNIDNKSNHDSVYAFISSVLGDKKWDDLHIVSPDAGSYKKIFKLCQTLNCNPKIILCNKMRDVSTGNIINVDVSGDVKDKQCFIVDDIIDGGRTFNELASILKANGASDLHLFASHGIFSNGYDELMKNFKTIGTTDSIREKYPDGIWVDRLAFK